MVGEGSGEENPFLIIGDERNSLLIFKQSAKKKPNSVAFTMLNHGEIERNWKGKTFWDIFNHRDLFLGQKKGSDQ
jgi:hypothetical protein